MYCPKCHNAMDPELPKCQYCGYLNREYDYNKDRIYDVDYPNMGLNIFSMLVPTIGIMLFLVNNNKKPKMAKSILKYSIFGFILYVVMFVFIKFVFKF